MFLTPDLDYWQLHAALYYSSKMLWTLSLLVALRSMYSIRLLWVNCTSEYTFVLAEHGNRPGLATVINYDSSIAVSAVVCIPNRKYVSVTNLSLHSLICVGRNLFSYWLDLQATSFNAARKLLCLNTWVSFNRHLLRPMFHSDLFAAAHSSIYRVVA